MRYIILPLLVLLSFSAIDLEAQNFTPPITWHKFITHNGNLVYQDCVNDTENGIIVGGWVDSVENAVLLQRQSLAAKFSCEGDLLWSRKIAVYNTQLGQPTSRVLETMDGNVMIVTTTAPEMMIDSTSDIVVTILSPNGNLIWKQIYDSDISDVGLSAIQCSDTSFVVVGMGVPMDDTPMQALVFNINADGNLIWNKRLNVERNLGLADPSSAIDLVEDSQGNLAITGTVTIPDSTMTDTTDYAFLLQLDSVGNVNFWNVYGVDTFDTRGVNITVNMNDEYFIVGETNEAGTGPDDFMNPYLLRLDNIGNVLNTTVYEVAAGNTANDVPRKVINRDGNIAFSVASGSILPMNGSTSGHVFLTSTNGNIDKIIQYNSIGIDPAMANGTNGGMFAVGGHIDPFGNARGGALRTDEDLFSGCEEMESTDLWNSRAGTLNLSDSLDFSESEMLVSVMDSLIIPINFAIDTFCENIPMNDAEFELVEDSICWHDFAEVINLSTGDIEQYEWTWGDGTSDDMENPEPHQYMIDAIITSGGNFGVGLSVSYECIVDFASNPIYVDLDFSLIDTLVCEGESVEIAGETISSVGRTLIPVERPGDCDSLVIVNLGNFPPAVEQLNFRDLCEGDVVVVNGEEFTAPNDGDILLPGASQNGCDSIILVNFESEFIIEPETEDVDLQVCEGETVNFLGNTYSAGDTDNIIVEDVSTDGCDSIYFVSVTPYPREIENVEIFVCEGESASFLGVPLVVGTQEIIRNGVTVNGCDSFYQVTLTELLDEEVFFGTFEVCPGGSIELFDSTYTEGNDLVYVSPGASTDGCDSVYIFDVIEAVPMEDLGEITICTGSVFSIGDQDYTAGMHEHIQPAGSSDECDTIFNFTIIEVDVIIDLDTFFICPETVLDFRGEDFAVSTSQYQTTISAPSTAECDTTFTFFVSEIGIGTFEFPNVFTPNRDDINDDFGIVPRGNASLDDIQTYEFRVFNRWGEKVFETTQPEDRWDGTCGGDVCASDVYVYYAIVEFAGSNGSEPCELTFNGDITLLN